MKISKTFSCFFALIILFSAIVGCTDNSVDTSESKEVQTVAPYDEILDDSTVILEENTNSERNANPDTWVATDGLNRTLVTNAEAGNVRENKYVGLFYWTWHGDHSKANFATNNQKTINDNPGLNINDYNSGVWETRNYSYFWNEPIYGFYSTTDTWVLRRQAEMFANAGVDFLAFDNTNGTYTWLTSVIPLCETFLQAKRDGVKVPQITFMLPFAGGEDSKIQLLELWEKIYTKEEYKELFFQVDGKPLILAESSCLSRTVPLEKEIINSLTFRKVNPNYVSSTGNGLQQWGWLSTYPQTFYQDRHKTPLQISVGVAQNHNYKTNQITAMNGEFVAGRTYSGKLNGYDSQENAKLYGANFAEQFEYALEIDPQYIFITGYNEWIAGRFDEWCGVTNAFPDQFNDEFSRDIEPSKGDLKDHYYYQMVNYIRKYKGVKEVPKASEPKYIDITKGFGQWADVAPTYIAYAGNTSNRDSAGYLDPEKGDERVPIQYTDTSGRNDIYDAKVARDSDNIYFMVRTVKDLTPYTDSDWMKLYIDVSSDENVPNWESFEYILNRISPTATHATLEKSTGGWSFEKAGEVEYSINKNVLMVKIPKEMLGITTDEFTINFKWSDNVKEDGDILNFYTLGDVAPGGRFKYQYNATKTAE